MRSWPSSTRPRHLPVAASVLLLLFGALGAVLASVPPPAQAQTEQGDAPGLGFRIAPAPDAATSERGGYFLVDAAPGDQVTQDLVVTNTSDEPVEVHLAAVDAGTGPTGGASYGLADEPAGAVGAWLSLEPDRVALDPDAQETVTVGGTVPDDADSGVHLGGVAAWIPDQHDPQEPEPDGDGPGAVVDVEHRRVVAVQFVLPGPDEPVLTVTGVEPAVRADAVWLRIAVANEGRGLTVADGVIEVLDPEFRREFHIDTFVPGTAIAYPIPWAETASEGEYRARVRLDYGTWTETWEGTFTIGREITDDLDERELAPPRLPTLPRWLLGTLTAVAGILLVVLLVLAWRRLRDRRRVGRHARDSWTLNPSG